MERPGGDLSWRGVHGAELHVQPRAERDASAAVADGRCASVLLVRHHGRTGLARDGRRPRTVPYGSERRGPVSLDPARTIYYRRARFTTHLPIDRRYSPAHYW